MAEKVKDYSGACWNALIEEETKESIARLYIDSLDASRAEKAAAAEMLEALRRSYDRLGDAAARINTLPRVTDTLLEVNLRQERARIESLLAKYATSPRDAT